ncbi:hypothetical protein ACYOEI_00280 [Singulisphaera rosea]
MPNRRSSGGKVKSVRVVHERASVTPRTPSAGAPTVLLREIDKRLLPANDLARALADAFGAEFISDGSAERLRLAGLNVVIETPRMVPQLFRRAP